ncbi:glycosyltransferase family 4 protein [Candidatus Uabimicrobium amorphum]|uniref:glycosyltransferase family 4 protein n=1 Tax=Uabimicrobium amorphum TaxID=2596890 RepID=UPI00125E9EBE|nr:glycosyltransferase family 4 protein [Candidatus Uabimicrobium amorphum]
MENPKPQRLHLLIICRSFPPRNCGVADYTYNLAKHLAQYRDMKVSIITSVNSQLEKIDNVDVFPIVDTWNLRGMKVVIDKIQQLSPQQILLQYVPYLYHQKGMPFYLCVLFWRLRAWKKAIFFHEVAIEISPRIKQLCVAIAQRFIAYFICRMSDHLIVSNECVAKFLGEKRTQLIHLGSNIPSCSLPENILQELRRQTVGECDLLFAIFGNIRNNHELLPTLKKLDSEQISWKILLVGSYQSAKCKPFYDEIVRLGMQEHIHVTGYVAADTAAKYLAMSDIFLIWEFPEKGIFLHSGSLCAAFANSLVIVSNKGELTDSILCRESGAILLKHLCTQTLIEHLNKIYTDATFRQEIQESAYSFFSKYLSWKVVCEKHRDLFQ